MWIIVASPSCTAYHWGSFIYAVEISEPQFFYPDITKKDKVFNMQLSFDFYIPHSKCLGWGKIFDPVG